MSTLAAKDGTSDQHPGWCQLGPECWKVESGAEHTGYLSQLWPQPDDAWIAVDLRHSEDMFRGENHGTTWVRITVTNEALVDESAAVHMLPDEAEMVGEWLIRAARKARFENWHTTETLAAERKVR